MNQNFFNITSRVFIITLLGTFLSAQQLDSQDIVYNELREIVENASRTNQKVWLEDFTGINWTYCPNASFAIDSLIQDFPDVLNTVEWHSPVFTPESIDFCFVRCGCDATDDDHERSVTTISVGYSLGDNAALGISYATDATEANAGTGDAATDDKYTWVTLTVTP